MTGRELEEKEAGGAEGEGLSAGFSGSESQGRVHELSPTLAETQKLNVDAEKCSDEVLAAWAP